MSARRATILVMFVIWIVVRAAGEDVLLRIEGGYLAYSYDHGQIFGENVTFKLGAKTVTCQYLKIDLTSRTGQALGGVVLRQDSDAKDADELLFDLQKKTGLLLRYGEAIDIRPLDAAAPQAEDARRELLDRRRGLEELTLARIRTSLIYSAAKTMEILTGLEVYGYNVTLYVEGFESVGFDKFKLSLSDTLNRNGLSLDKIWFTKTQGLFGKLSYTFEREKKIQSFTQVYYEEHSILKEYSGLPRQLDLQTSTTFALGTRSNLGLAGNYNSTSLWNARAWFDRAWKDGKNKVLLDFTFNKPLQARSEAWFGVQSALDFDRWGRMSVQGKVEVHNQTLLNLSYNASLLKKVALTFMSTYSRILIGGTGNVSKILTGDLNLTYNADRFSLAGDYYLNYDLFGNQRLTRPQMRFGLTPVTFYGGLLTATLQNMFVINDVSRGSAASASYSNNTALSLALAPLAVRPDLNVQVNLSVEQFLEKQGRNFTSGGVILKADQTFASGFTLEGFYSLQSRRRSKGWLIEGTTSQDLSAVVRVNPSERLNGWISVSFDPKSGEWKQSFADISIGLIKNWKFRSMLNYDFYRRTIGNVDLYLIRHAGRFDLRFIWRSISKQFLIELIPSAGGPNS